MASAVTATVTDLPESRVRVEAEVPSAEVERQVQQTARRLGRELKLPGFRKGKVPPPLVIRRMGRDAVLSETLDSSLPRWYTAAITETGLVTVGSPDLKLGGLPGEGEPLRFSVEIGVRPTATLGEYRGLDVPRREPAAEPEAVDQRLEAERERLARLEPVERPAQDGDFLVVDFVGSIDGEPFKGGEARDQPLELGSGSLVPGFEDGLLGASAGEERTVSVTFPDDYGAEALAGREAEFAVTVKRVQEKHVPELNDDLAEAAGFDDLDELREDIRGRLAEADESAVDTEFRQAAVDVAVDAATVEVPEPLAQARAEELVDDVIHSMEHRGISKDAYLRITGKTEEQLLEDARPAAERALRREAVLAAIVEAEAIAPGDDEVEAELGDAAAAEGVSVRKLLERVKSAGRLEDLRRDLASRRAADLVVEQAKPIPVEQAQARDKLWTPEKDEPAGAGKGGLWTPDS